MRLDGVGTKLWKIFTTNVVAVKTTEDWRGLARINRDRSVSTRLLTYIALPLLLVLVSTCVLLSNCPEFYEQQYTDSGYQKLKEVRTARTSHFAAVKYCREKSLNLDTCQALWQQQNPHAGTWAIDDKPPIQSEK